MPRRMSGRGEEGILLLESLIGLGIIGIVAVAVLAATGSQVRSADKADVLLTAAALAQDRLVSIQLLDNEGLADPPDSLLAGAFPAPFDEFTWRTEVVAAEEEYDLFAVRIEVEGRGEMLPIETLLHRPPLVGGMAAGGGGGGGGSGRGGREGQGGRGGGEGSGGGRGSGGRGGEGTRPTNPPAGGQIGRPPGWRGIGPMRPTVPPPGGQVGRPPGGGGTGPTRPTIPPPEDLSGRRAGGYSP